MSKIIVLLTLLWVPSIVSGISEPAEIAEKIAREQLPKRIVGGHDVSIDHRPWQVGILRSKYRDDYWAHFCGGTLIDKSWIVTAAHCVDRGTMPDEIHVLTHSAELNGSGNRFAVEAIIIHPKWCRSTRDNDIALLKIAGRAGIEQPIAIAGLDALDVSQDIEVSGWGRTQSLGSRVQNLQSVQIPLAERSVCNGFDSYNGRITGGMFCAGLSKGGVDACIGDSGGPATVMLDDTPKLAGIVSWGDGCGYHKKFGVYVWVPSFIPWIESTISSY